MEYKIKRDSQTSCLMIELSGRFNVADLEKCYQDMLVRPDWEKGTDILWDARTSNFAHLTHEHIRDIAFMTEKYRDQRGPGLAAWVMGRDVDYGIGRMFEMINENHVIYEFRVFRSPEDAKRWLLESRAQGNRRTDSPT